MPNVLLEIQSGAGTVNVSNDAEGRFSVNIPAGGFTVKLSGSGIAPVTRTFSSSDKTEDVQLKINYVVPPVNASVTIQADALEPAVEQRNDTVYKNSLFNRDDQLVFTLNAGINAGQHEGGGKSLPIPLTKNTVENRLENLIRERSGFC
ncbi:MAG: hypothetical protein ACRD6X_05865 [Pyrinomonadaceae bacterium]